MNGSIMANRITAAAVENRIWNSIVAGSSV